MHRLGISSIAELVEVVIVYMVLMSGYIILLYYMTYNSLFLFVYYVVSVLYWSWLLWVRWRRNL